MGLANEISKAAFGGKYTAIDVADWLAEQQNLAAKSGDSAKASLIWSLLKEWSKKTSQD